jgi:hypothetical protein
MDAWETLIAGSTIDTGDAWDHLINQGGTGTGTIDYIILADGMSVEMANETVAVELDQQNITADVDSTPVGVGIDDTEILAEITNGGL